MIIIKSWLGKKYNFAKGFPVWRKMVGSFLYPTETKLLNAVLGVPGKK